MAYAPGCLVRLAVLMATLWPCTSSETSNSLIKTDFSITIPKEGLQADVQKTFHLGPSQTLGVFDFSNSASYLPTNLSSAHRSSDDVSSNAFVFESGACNLQKTIAYIQLFRGYETPLWIRTSSSVKRNVDVPTTVTTYKFTNPPKENLNGGVSFCVRFKSDSTSTGSSDTSASTMKPTTGPTNSDSSQQPPPPLQQQQQQQQQQQSEHVGGGGGGGNAKPVGPDGGQQSPAPSGPNAGQAHGSHSSANENIGGSSGVSSHDGATGEAAESLHKDEHLSPDDHNQGVNQPIPPKVQGDSPSSHAHTVPSTVPSKDLSVQVEDSKAEGISEYATFQVKAYFRLRDKHPYFSITIPKEGLQADVQKTFHLGPSQTLGVFDFSNTASYLPALPASESGEGTSDQVASSAFVFENGKCNFDRVIGYKQLFPGYDTPLWVRGSSPAKSEGDDSATVTTFKFTNPPEENLYGGVSFCVRFKSVRLPTDSEGTSTSTAKPTTGAPQLETEEPQEQHGSEGESAEPGGAGSAPTPPSVEQEGETEDGGADAHRPGNGGTGQESPDGEGHEDPPVSKPQPEGESQHGQQNGVVEDQQNAESRSQTSPSGGSSTGNPIEIPDTPGPGVVRPEASEQHDYGDSSLQTDKATLGNVHSRRLADQDETKDTFYLTVVMHSAARSFTTVAALLLASLSAMATALLDAF
ncbi:UNVERIFIED_CONTAM: Toxoplasma gondii family A protein [Hammondia hammondi]|eukprot:XP_008888235.1 Toxoplasma gondii family A protein [Hammondia hammondi]